MQLSAFDLLQVSMEASDDDIKSAYLTMVQDNSPDKNPERFQEIRQAYEQIATKEDRLNYELFQAPRLGFHELLSHLMKETQPKTAAPSGELLRSLIKEGLRAK